MGDGYWDKRNKSVVICTDNFSEQEILNLIKILEKNFDLIGIPKKRVRQTGIICWRIRFSIKNDNINLL